MDVEILQDEKGNAKAYRFKKWEKQAICRGLASEIKRRHKQIERIDNNPKNEGQVTYLEEKRILRAEAEDLQEIITEFSK